MVMLATAPYSKRKKKPVKNLWPPPLLTFLASTLSTLVTFAGAFSNRCPLSVSGIMVETVIDSSNCFAFVDGIETDYTEVECDLAESYAYLKFSEIKQIRTLLIITNY